MKSLTLAIAARVQKESLCACGARRPVRRGSPSCIAGALAIGAAFAVDTVARRRRIRDVELEASPSARYAIVAIEATSRAGLAGRPEVSGNT